MISFIEITDLVIDVVVRACIFPRYIPEFRNFGISEFFPSKVLASLSFLLPNTQNTSTFARDESLSYDN